MRMALNILTGRQAGVDIPNPLMVRDKIDTFTDPHGCREIAIYRFKRLKLSVAFNIYPELACCAAPIACPACGFPRQSAEDNTASIAKIDVIRGPVR